MTDPTVNDGSGPVVRVSSHAQIEVPADRASLSVHLTSSVGGRKERAAAEVHAQRAAVEQVLDRHAAVIERSAFHRMSVREVDTEQDGWQWQASLSLEIQIVEVEGVPALYNDLRRLGPSSLSGPFWSLTDHHPAHDQARAAAIGFAISRAREMAAAAGTVVLALDWLADADVEAPMARRASMIGGAGGAYDEPYGDDLDITPEPQQVYAAVHAQYRVAPVTYDS